MEDIVVVSAVRAPVGKFQRALFDLSAPQLGALAVREAVARARVDPAQVDECILASGARVLVTLIYEMIREMIRRDAHREVAARCLGGGNSVAIAVER